MNELKSYFVFDTGYMDNGAIMVLAPSKESAISIRITIETSLG